MIFRLFYQSAKCNIIIYCNKCKTTLLKRYFHSSYILFILFFFFANLLTMLIGLLQLSFFEQVLNNIDHLPGISDITNSYSRCYALGFRIHVIRRI